MDHLFFSAEHGLVGDTLTSVVHVFGSRGVRGGEVIEFDAAAFDASLAAGRVMAFYAHDPTRPLAAQDAGTLKIGRTRVGDSHRLESEIRLGKQSYALDLRESLTDGTIKGMSFGVLPGRSATRREGGRTVRTYQSVPLVEVSPVAVPFFDGTSALLHSALAEVNERERIIRARARAGGLNA